MTAEPKPRTRTRATAKKAGSTFERTIADTLSAIWQSTIDRKVKTGSKDQGDIGGMTVGGNPVIVECKSTRGLSLGTWQGEARDEACNVAQALLAKGRPPRKVHAIVVHKRHGKSLGAEQWVTMTVFQLVELLEDAGGER